MHVARLEATDFRCYPTIDLELSPAVTLITGDNGQGKTSLLEAIGWLALRHSFRGVADAALVRDGAATAVIRAVVIADGHERTLEAEIPREGRNRVRVNQKAVTRARAGTETLLVVVFSPDDLDLVKGSPSGRRDYLDDLLAMAYPRFRGVRSEYDRALRQRNALLRNGVHSATDRETLTVLDVQLASAGAAVVRSRLELATGLAPALDEAYRSLAPAGGVRDRYDARWAPDGLPERIDDAALEQLLADALGARRAVEIERRMTLVGPHRDDWELGIVSRSGVLDSRTRASQGEQRTLALALRLAALGALTEITGSRPVLLLDDVFSELDEHRARALVASLPPGQTVLTSTGGIPEGIAPEERVRVDGAHARVERAAS